MVQRWHHLLFAHWRCEVANLRPLIPSLLDIDTYDGSAWIAVVPFYMSGVRMRATPSVPTAHAFEELNVRTYVTLDGRPGIWFFSLDCASTLATIGARIGAHLPYFRASMRMARHDDGSIDYESRRWTISGVPASFAGRYRGTADAFEPAPGSLEHFLTERYCFYASAGARLWRGDIVHPRWRLQIGEAALTTNTMLAAAGVHASTSHPLLHYAAFQDVRFWWPQRVR